MESWMLEARIKSGFSDATVSKFGSEKPPMLVMFPAAIQALVPPANVIALFESASAHGVYKH